MAAQKTELFNLDQSSWMSLFIFLNEIVVFVWTHLFMFRAIIFAQQFSLKLNSWAKTNSFRYFIFVHFSFFISYTFTHNNNNQPFYFITSQTLVSKSNQNKWKNFCFVLYISCLFQFWQFHVLPVNNNNNKLIIDGNEN